MSQFRLPDQVPVSWARISASGEGGTKAAHIDGGGTNVYNYLMHTELMPAPANISLQTRLRAKLINMDVDNASFEGAAVRHRGFRMTGTEPNLSLDTQVWSSNPQHGGRTAWISGNTSGFQDYNFIVALPEYSGVDYVTWELVVRAPGQIIVSNVECRHFYGRLYDYTVQGSQVWLGTALEPETFNTSISTGAKRWLKYIRNENIKCRKGQLIIAESSGGVRGAVINQALADIPTTTGFMLKMRRTGTTTDDIFDIAGVYSTTIKQGVYTLFSDTRQQRARYDYERFMLIGYLNPHYRSTDTMITPDVLAYTDVNVDLTIADFVAPSQ